MNTERPQCAWPGIEDPEYTRYHNEEWGVPVTDSLALFEKLVLEGFQAGLSWLTILKKRENFRSAFADFDPHRIASFNAKEVERLMHDTGIVRNKAKIEATISNAKAYLELAKSEDFAEFIWGHVNHQPIVNRWKTMADIPAQTPHSKALSKSLKAAGFRFVGPTTMYALMQSSGLVNDHLLTCHRHAECARLQSKIPQTRTH